MERFLVFLLSVSLSLHFVFSGRSLETQESHITFANNGVQQQSAGEELLDTVAQVVPPHSEPLPLQFENSGGEILDKTCRDVVLQADRQNQQLSHENPVPHLNVTARGGSNGTAADSHIEKFSEQQIAAHVEVEVQFVVQESHIAEKLPRLAVGVEVITLESRNNPASTNVNYSKQESASLTSKEELSKDARYVIQDHGETLASGAMVDQSPRQVDTEPFRGGVVEGKGGSRSGDPSNGVTIGAEHSSRDNNSPSSGRTISKEAQNLPRGSKPPGNIVVESSTLSGPSHVDGLSFGENIVKDSKGFTDSPNMETPVLDILVEQTILKSTPQPDQFPNPGAYSKADGGVKASHCTTRDSCVDAVRRLIDGILIELNIARTTDPSGDGERISLAQQGLPRDSKPSMPIGNIALESAGEEGSVVHEHVSSTIWSLSRTEWLEPSAIGVIVKGARESRSFEGSFQLQEDLVSPRNSKLRRSSEQGPSGGKIVVESAREDLGTTDMSHGGEASTENRRGEDTRNVDSFSNSEDHPSDRSPFLLDEDIRTQETAQASKGVVFENLLKSTKTTARRSGESSPIGNIIVENSGELKTLDSSSQANSEENDFHLFHKLARGTSVPTSGPSPAGNLVVQDESEAVSLGSSQKTVIDSDDSHLVIHRVPRSTPVPLVIHKRPRRTLVPLSGPSPVGNLVVQDEGETVNRAPSQETVTESDDSHLVVHRVPRSTPVPLVFHKLPRGTRVPPSGPSPIGNLIVKDSSETTTPFTSSLDSIESQDSHLVINQFTRGKLVPPSGPSPIHKLVVEPRSPDLPSQEIDSEDSHLVFNQLLRGKLVPPGGPSPIHNLVVETRSTDLPSPETSDYKDFHLVINQFPRGTLVPPGGPSPIHNLVVETISTDLLSQETRDSTDFHVVFNQLPRDTPVPPSGPSPIHNLVVETGSTVLPPKESSPGVVEFADSTVQKPQHCRSVSCSNAPPFARDARSSSSIETMPKNTPFPLEVPSTTGNKMAIDALQEFAAPSTILDREILESPLLGQFKREETTMNNAGNYHGLAAPSTLLDREILEGPLLGQFEREETTMKNKNNDYHGSLKLKGSTLEPKIYREAGAADRSLESSLPAQENSTFFLQLNDHGVKNASNLTSTVLGCGTSDRNVGLGLQSLDSTNVFASNFEVNASSDKPFFQEASNSKEAGEYNGTPATEKAGNHTSR